MSSFTLFDAVESLFGRIRESIVANHQAGAETADLCNLHLLELEALFGHRLLLRAIEIIDGKQLITLYRTPDGDSALVEVPGSQLGTVYKVFPHINFCACESFRGNVLSENNQPTCKHVLAARLALILGKTTEKVLSEDTLISLKQNFAKDCFKQTSKH
ncbi:zinc finger SWIM domain-containing protein 7-like [Anopheles nili]|uniref:zinc finger SWIM domain-containing protein 7-like n=1 Tax=Anopheles nili TaxID=185578 RepID=UPI00237B0421|nr:zinc finger SWIM domain-containing protein 7-like [Anopheles nili]